QASAVTATFALKSYPVTVVLSGAGGGLVASTPAGIQCGLACAETFPYGTALTLTAAPAAGSTFAGWSGGCLGAGACALVVTQGVTLTAVFNAPPPQFKAYLPLVTGSAAPAGPSTARWPGAGWAPVAALAGWWEAASGFVMRGRWGLVSYTF